MESLSQIVIVNGVKRHALYVIIHLQNHKEADIIGKTNRTAELFQGFFDTNL